MPLIDTVMMFGLVTTFVLGTVFLIIYFLRGFDNDD